ncbi:erythromycin esterase family protein [Soonwooa sp.]|uniref:erythromycin esterase family protein n=1 Tax=Soonwooa sp. TaxID=1938592 RepID=UPI00262E07E0|nr:erythromycin esterase family protein [Soonwooa sp.]
MKLKLGFICIMLFLVVQSQSYKELTSEQKEYLSKFTYPLKSIEQTTTDNSDLSVLDKLIGNAKIIGLGEATHGSSEVYKLKYRISEYLIENKNINVFVLEASMPESFLMNQYTIDNQSSAKKLLSGMNFWIWETQESLDFVEWLHDYNSTHSSKVYFDGFDMLYTQGAIAQLKDVYTQNNFHASEIEQLEKALQANNNGQRFYSKKDKQLIKELLIPIQKQASKISDTDTKNRFLQNLTIIDQNIELTYLRRDQFMAQNIKWIANEKPNSKLIVSAHNNHISKSGSDKMGHWLAQDFGSDYINFGFAFYEGHYSASINGDVVSYLGETAFPGTLEYTLNSLNIPVFILDLKSIKQENNPLAKWLMKNILFRKTGSGLTKDKSEFESIDVTNAFDYLIFINKSTSSNLLVNASKK